MISSYIPQRVKRAKQQITVKLYHDQLEMLDRYGRFIDDSREYIISQALDLVFKKDKEFARWLEEQAGSTNHGEPIASGNGPANTLVETGPREEEREKRLRSEAVLDRRRESA